MKGNEEEGGWRMGDGGWGMEAFKEDLI